MSTSQDSRQYKSVIHFTRMKQRLGHECIKKYQYLQQEGDELWLDTSNVGKRQTSNQSSISEVTLLDLRHVLLLERVICIY